MFLGTGEQNLTEIEICKRKEKATSQKNHRKKPVIAALAAF